MVRAHTLPSDSVHQRERERERDRERERESERERERESERMILAAARFNSAVNLTAPNCQAFVVFLGRWPVAFQHIHFKPPAFLTRSLVSGIAESSTTKSRQSSEPHGQ